MGRTMPVLDLSQLLADSRESPHWDDVASRCLTCGNCTMVCPTCFCTTTEDVTDLTGDHAERWRVWDSCYSLDFSYLHGGSVRTSGQSRYRQWITHKLGTWHDQFGSSGCVGCGRCIAWCPTGIDITQEVSALASLRDAATTDEDEDAMTGTVAARISAHPFFAALTDEQRAALAGDGEAVMFTAGERLFDEGGSADRFWLIEDGSIALDMRVPGRGDQIVETLASGTVLGWSWLHPPYRWHFGAVARLATTAIEFDAPRYAVAATLIRLSGTRPFACSRRSSPNGCRRPACGCWTCMPPRPSSGSTRSCRRTHDRPGDGHADACRARARGAQLLPGGFRREDTGDTVTVELGEPDGPVPAFAPGQFAMLTALGVGEVPISVSGLGDSGGGRARLLQHTLRAVGAVTRALCAVQPGGLIGVRGPFGTGWDVASAAGRDIVIVAGGIGLAPLRPVVLTALADRSRYGRIVLLAGAEPRVTCSTPASLNDGAATGLRWRSRSTMRTAAGAVRSGW